MLDRGALAWARVDLRRRWRSLVVLGLLAGITAGFAMAALAGARRADTALSRFRARTRAADAVVFASQVGVPHPDWSKLRSRPEVADLGVWDLLFGNQNGQPGGLLFPANDKVFEQRFGTPMVLAGRMWNPSAPDEVVVSQAMAKGGFPVGSTFSFKAFGAEQADADTEPTGPDLTFHVVGEVRTINEFLFTDGQFFVGPGFVARYGSQVQLAENADVRLRDGAADVAALQRDVNQVVAPGTTVLDLHAVSRRVDTTISVEHAALLMLAVAIAVAGGVLLAQALRRSAGVIEDDTLVLRSMGMTPATITSAATAPHVLTAGVTIAVALVTAVVGSAAFPVGLSRKIDPDVGVHADWAVLLAGAAVAAGFVLLDVYLVARGAARRPGLRTARPSRLVGSIRAHTPVSVGIGASMAFESGAGRNRVAVRPALIGAAIGVLGVVATLSVEHAVNDALSHPERAGVTWDATVEPPTSAYQSHGLDPQYVAKVTAAAPVGSVVSTAGRMVVPISGLGVPVYSVSADTPGHPIDLAITEGRAPTRAGEGAIGPKTARDLHVRIGDTVHFGDEKIPVTIVGFALFPPDVHAEFDEGMWVTAEQLEAVVPAVSAEDLFQGAERAVLVRFPVGVDKATDTTKLGAALGEDAQVGAAEVPVELTNLRNVRVLPVVLAAFLALLAVAAVSHVLVTSSRQRRRDFAVLRAMGFNRRGTRLALNAQGTAIGLVGLAVGVPLGIAVGRTCWHWVADRVPLEDVPPLALIAVLVTVPAAILVVNALAVWPGRSVARLHPADLLRSE
jgi:hypothetical protein